MTSTQALRQTADMLRDIYEKPELADKFEAAANGRRLQLTEAELELLRDLTLPAEVFAML